MVLKKTINTDKLMNTGPEKLEMIALHTANQFQRDSFNAYQEVQDRLEINDLNE